MVSGVALVVPAVAHAHVSAVPPEQPLPISAPLTGSQRATLNSQIDAVDGTPIPDSVISVTISQDKVTFVDAAGNAVAVPPSPYPIREGVIDEVKRAVGACLGINFTANVSAWTAIQNSVNTGTRQLRTCLMWRVCGVSCGR
jgi:hypothetical protein